MCPIIRSVPGACCRVRPRRWLSRHWVVYDLSRGPLVVHVHGRKWHGLSAFSYLKGGRVHPLWDEAEWIGDVLVKKRVPKPEGVGDVEHLAPVESTVFGRLHPLVAHCCVIRYEDGSSRKPGWFTLKTMGSAWAVEVKDPETCSRMLVVQATLDDALALASMLLESEDAPWEPDPWLRQNEAKKRK